MKIPLSWLREFTDVQLTAEQLAEVLTLRGLEVRGVERWGANWNKMVVGELLEVGPHPKADRLQLTKVRIGDGPILNIVCGARNIAAGQRIPVALVGAEMPDGRRIERAEKMGVASEGMLCSGQELDATDDGDGILILDPSAPLGVPLVDYLGEDVIDVDVKPNRGDLLSILGLAREVGAITGAPVAYAARPLKEGGDAVGAGLALRVADETLAPHVVLRVVDGLKVAASPDRVQMRLKAAGLRSISNVVDATNYIMLELGKPTHAFDRAKVGNTVQIRLAKKGESLETLDHEVRSLDATDLVVADERAALALAGVMGGASSEVTPSTTSVIIESAIFAPTSVRRTAQRHNLRSEASHRFERGQERRLAVLGADQVAALLTEWAGGLARSGRLVSGAEEVPAATLNFRPARVRALLGVALTDEEQVALLGTIGISAEAVSDATKIVVTPKRSLSAAKGSVRAVRVPSWRSDLEIEADLAEEVARLYGYERIPTSIPSADLPPHRPSPTLLRDRVRRLLADAGLHEVVTHALVSAAQAELWSEPTALVTGSLAASEGAAGGASIILKNPLSADHDRLRQSLLPSLLDRVDANLRYGATSGAIFEVGRGYGSTKGVPSEWTRLAIAVWGEREQGAPSAGATRWNLDELKRLLAQVAHLVGERPAYGASIDSAVLHPGINAGITGDRFAGLLGELHPASPTWRDEPRVLLAEVAIAGLRSGRLDVAQVSLPPTTPPVTRDIALLIPAATTVGHVVDVARKSVSRATAVELFDLFAGAPLAPGERSAGLRFTFQPSATGADDEAITAELAAFEGAVLRACGARIRGVEGQ
ncbi:MAG: phenylalanine--tRNA ligase subunit beta [Chloroflexi bacterium]|nr:phenylalanine--tRNA ligase subunit beta [Chloroflexota bacterium]